LAAIETIGAELAGSNRPFVVTSGLALLKPGQVSTEADDADPNAPVKHRHASDEATIALASKGVRTSLIRLPPSVHGKGDHGFVPMIIETARKHGVSAYIGGGSNRWPAVHRLDAARLYRLALEKGPAGSKFHGVGDQGVPTREIAEVIGRRLNLPVVSKSPEEAAEHFTWMARFFAIDCPASSALTEQQLGWTATQPGLLEDMDNSYFS
jgi:nucleoside-diphosphate-sugar epimerase